MPFFLDLPFFWEEGCARALETAVGEEDVSA